MGATQSSDILSSTGVKFHEFQFDGLVQGESDASDGFSPGGFDGLSFDDPGDTGTGPRVDVALWDTEFQDDNGFRLPLGLGDSEEGGQRAHQYLAELDSAARSHISNAGKRRITEEKITTDSFDSAEERDSFRIIRTQATIILNPSVTAQLRLQALRFFFATGPELPDNEITLDLCADVLSARPYVFRTRMQYEFFRKWHILCGAFDFPCGGIPVVLRDSIRMTCPVFSDELIEIASLVWKNPGIHSSELDPFFNDWALMRKEFQVMETEGIISINDAGQCYLTGRNPRRRAPGTMHDAPQKGGSSLNWSSLWGK